jgi:hypothetical protein
MNQHDLDLVRQILEAIRDGLRAFAPAYGQEQSVDIALEQPRWWIANERLRQNANDHRDVAPSVEGLDAVQQHWLASDPPELFELAAAHATSRAPGDDDDANVGILGARSQFGRCGVPREMTRRSDVAVMVVVSFFRAHENKDPNRSPTVRMPTV